MEELKQLASGGRRPGLLFHVLLLCWTVLVIVVGLFQHRSIGELWEDSASGTTEQRLEALQALAQRAGPEEIVRQYPMSLLEADDARLRELAFTNLFSRSPLTALQQADLARIAEPAERFRAAVWLHCRSATPRRITWADLDIWFDEAQRPRD